MFTLLMSLIYLSYNRQIKIKFYMLIHDNHNHNNHHHNHQQDQSEHIKMTFTFTFIKCAKRKDVIPCLRRIIAMIENKLYEFLIMNTFLVLRYLIYFFFFSFSLMLLFKCRYVLCSLTFIQFFFYSVPLMLLVDT